MKTYKGWQESKFNQLYGFDTGTSSEKGYLEIGDEVDESIYEYFIGCLPPFMSNGIVQISEPYNYTNGGNTYATLKRGNDKWIFKGLCHKYDDKNQELFLERR